jgi:hypothetical protein
LPRLLRPVRLWPMPPTRYRRLWPECGPLHCSRLLGMPPSSSFSYFPSSSHPPT